MTVIYLVLALLYAKSEAVSNGTDIKGNTENIITKTIDNIIQTESNVTGTKNLYALLVERIGNLRRGRGATRGKNTTETPSRFRCSPGSMYVIRCKQCICPYMGSIKNFCRPLPKEYYCEDPFPGAHYAFAVGTRRIVEGEGTNASTAVHKTRYDCDQSGKIMDECFVCGCHNNTVEAENCFRSESELCNQEKPSFLNI